MERAGNFVTTIEEERGKFFCTSARSGSGRNRDYEKIAIFGSVRGRRGAELKVLSAVKTKVPGYFSNIRDEAVDRDRGKEERGARKSPAPGARTP